MPKRKIGYGFENIKPRKRRRLVRAKRPVGKKYLNYRRRYGSNSKYRDTKGAWYPNMWSLATKYAAAYRDPFTPQRYQPKIPDGKTVVSVGLRQIKSEEISVGDEVTLILLIPGLDNVLCIWEAPTGFRPLRLADKNTFDVSEAGGTISLSQPQETAIHRWRLVSQGLHIDLINNAEENDGWFAACRIGCPSDAREWALATQTGGPQKDYGLFPRTMNDIITGDMERLPSYVEGSLRDIKRYTFNLRPEGNEHDFIKLRNEYILTNSTETVDATADIVTFTTPPVAYPVAKFFQHDLAETHNFIAHTVDQGFDCVLIKIRGRYTGPDGNNSRLKMTVVSNQEIIFDERSMNSRFHTRSPQMPNFQSIQGNRSQGVAAAQNATKYKTS